MEGNLDLPARSALTAVKSDADPVDIHDSSKHRRSSSPTANAHQRDRLRAARRSPPTETIPRRAQQQQSGQQSPQRRPMSRTQQAHAQIQPAHFQKPAPSLDSWFAAKATLDKSGGLPAQLVPGSGRPSSVLQADVSSHTPHSGLGNVRDFRQDLPASDPRRIGLESRLKRQSSDDTGELAAALNGMTVKTETQITATGRRPPLPVQWGSVTLPKRKETPVNVCFNFNLSDCDGSCHKDHVCARCHSRSHSSRACTLPQMKGGI